MTKAIPSQMPKVIKPSNGSRAKRTPAAVATPLPPLKLRKTGYRWPKNTASATAPTSPCENPYFGPNVCARNTASQPLAMSPSSVNAAAALLPLRKTLVAPGFFDP